VWLIILTAAVLGLGTVYYAAITAYLLVTSSAKPEGTVVMIFLTTLFLVLFLLTSAGPLHRIIHAEVNYLRHRQWAGWRSVLAGHEPPNPPSPAHASLLPQDSDIGYDGLAWLRIILMTFDFLYAIRIFRSLVSSHVRRQ
jgi:hypothetical protein